MSHAHTFRSRPLKSNYYTVVLPGDLDTDPHRLAEQAIREAQARERVFHLPCTWQATLIAGTIGESLVLVYRVRKIHY